MRANQHHNHCNMRSWTDPLKRILGHHEGVHVGETENEGKPRPQPLQREDMKQPLQTVQCTPTITHAPHISFSVKYLSWGCLNGLGPLRELGLRDCVPATAEGGRSGTVGECIRYTPGRSADSDG